MALEGFPQRMSLLPLDPTSRGLRPRTAALRSSCARLSSARLPQPRMALRAPINVST